MRNTFKIILSFLLIICSAFASAQRSIDVLHYKYEITLSDNTDEIQGKATIRFKALRASSQFFFDLKKINKDYKGMILVKATEGSSALKAYHPGDSLQLVFDKTIAAGEEKEITIEYTGIPDDGLIISKNKFGKRCFFSDNWPDRAHHWIPCNDNPADKASVEFIVTAPSHYKVVSNGLLQSEQNISNAKTITHWKEDIAIPTKVMVIGVADFAVDTAGTVDGIPVSSWVFSQNKNDGFKDYSIAPGILSFFIKYIAPFPYKKLANVQSKTIFGGMENASAIFYAESSVDGRQDQEELIAHEIVHQWFGNTATEKSFSHLWLSEGFATYLTHIYIESKYGTDSLNTEMKNERNEILAFNKGYKHPVVDSVAPYMELLNTNSYQKGSWVLHMLRRQLGDSVFHKAIREYYKRFAFSNADTRDLQKVFEDVSGKKLSAFFQQWLYETINPSLHIQWNWNETTKQTTITITQLQQPFFQFPLQFSLQTNTGKKTLQTIEITTDKNTFTLPSSEKIIRLTPDPETSLLFEYDIQYK